MTRSISTLKKLVLAAFIGAAALVPTTAIAGDYGHGYDRGQRYYGHGKHKHDKGHIDFGVSILPGGCVQPATDRVWVPPVVRTECERVWVPAVYRTECGKVWIEPVYDWQTVVRWDCGRRVVTREYVKVREGFWQETSRQVEVTPGHWENRERQIVIREGYWETRQVAAPAGGLVFNFGYRR
jgi:hypothetical protein